MKRLIAIGCGLLLAASAMAADYTAIAKQVLNKNATRTFQCAFTQVKRVKVMKNKEVTSQGTLYGQPGKMAMHYTNPAGDYFILDDKQFVKKSNGKKMNLDIKEGSPFRTLRNTLLNCMKGDIESIIKENNGTCAYTQEGSLHVFTITTANKNPKGYSQLVLKFDTKSLELKEMVLTEVAGNVTTYTLGAYQAGTTDASVFQAK